MRRCEEVSKEKSSKENFKNYNTIRNLEIPRKLGTYTNNFKTNNSAYITRNISEKIETKSEFDLLHELQEKNEIIKKLSSEKIFLNEKINHLKEVVDKLLVKNNELERYQKTKNLNDSYINIKKDYSYDAKESRNSTPKTTATSILKLKTQTTIENKNKSPEREFAERISQVFLDLSSSMTPERRQSSITSSRKDFHLIKDEAFENDYSQARALQFQLNHVKLRTTKVLQSYAKLFKENRHRIRLV